MARIWTVYGKGPRMVIQCHNHNTQRCLHLFTSACEEESIDWPAKDTFYLGNLGVRQREEIRQWLADQQVTDNDFLDRVERELDAMTGAKKNVAQKRA